MKKLLLTVLLTVSALSTYGQADPGPFNTRYYTNIADMVANANPRQNNKLAIVLGYSRPGDGGYGWFYPEASVTTNKLRWKSPLVSASYVWVRQIGESPVSPTFFGADPSDSDDDTDALQEARDYCAENGKELYIPVGDIRSTEPLVVWENGVVFGHSLFRSFITITSTNHGVVSPDSDQGLSYFQMANLTIRSTASDGENYGLYLNNIADGRFDNVRVFRTSRTQGFLHGLHLTGNVNGGAYRSEFTHLWVYPRSNYWARGIFSSASDFGFAGNSTKILGGYIQGDGGISAEINDTTDFAIIGCNFEGFARKAIVLGPASRGATIMGNRIEIDGPGNTNVTVPLNIRDELGVGDTFPETPNIGIEIAEGSTNHWIAGNYTYPLSGTGILDYNTQGQNQIFANHSTASGLGNPQGLTMMPDLTLNNQRSWQLRLQYGQDHQTIFNVLSDGRLRIWPSSASTFFEGNVGAHRDTNTLTRVYAQNDSTDIGAEAGFEAVAHDARGRFVALHHGYAGDDRYDGFVGVAINTNAAGISMWATGTGQVINWLAGDGTIRARVNGGGMQYPELTANSVLVLDANKNVQTTTINTNELNCLEGVTTNVVDQSRGVYTTNSLTGGGTLAADRTLKLVNDQATPGATKYYGTDSGGTRGWYDFSQWQLADQDLTTISALTGQGYVVRVAANDYQLRSITGGQNISVSNGDGTAGNTTIALTITNSVTIALDNPATTATTGENKNFWRAPYAGTVKAVYGLALVPSSSGSLTLDVKKNGTTILSSPVSLGAGVTNATATVSVTAIAAGDIISADVDAAGTDTQGPQIQILYTNP